MRTHTPDLAAAAARLTPASEASLRAYVETLGTDGPPRDEGWYVLLMEPYDPDETRPLLNVAFAWADAGGHHWVGSVPASEAIRHARLPDPGELLVFFAAITHAGKAVLAKLLNDDGCIACHRGGTTGHRDTCPLEQLRKAIS